MVVAAGSGRRNWGRGGRQGLTPSHDALETRMWWCRPSAWREDEGLAESCDWQRTKDLGSSRARVKAQSRNSRGDRGINFCRGTAPPLLG
jgi:hypothetical protein